VLAAPVSISIMDELVVFLLGSLAGILTGIMPGIGPAHLLAILYVWMKGWDPVHLMIFYIAYITVANMIDSIPSLYFGVPGELQAIPASRESRSLSEQGLTQIAVQQAAIGRLIGSIVALFLGSLTISWIFSYPEIFSSRWQMIFYVITLVCIMIAGNNRWWENIIFMVCGMGLSLIGYNYYTQQVYATFGWEDLYSGLPMLPVLIGIYVIPQLIQYTQKNKEYLVSTPQQHQANYLPVMARSSVVGYVLGLIPGMSYVLSSTACYNLEKWWQRKYGNKNLSVASVIASETGSSTGSVSMLIPLLLFGIPIIASEVIIYDLMIDAGAIFSMGAFLKDNYIVLIGWFVLSCAFGVLISWPLSGIFRSLAQKMLDARFIWMIYALILISMILNAIDQQKIILHGLVFFVSLMFGWILRNKDVMPMVFVFVLGSNLQSVIYNMIQLYL
jgi:putative tricarboxylic transport membrane protein